MNSKAIVILSGGLDSSVAMVDAVSRHTEVEALSFFYGQRHARELQSAMHMAKYYLLKHTIVDMVLGQPRYFGAVPPAQLMQKGALTAGEVMPHGHYEDVSMKRTVVPNRNMIFIALAAARAVQVEASEIVYGAHAGDHAIYPDCRPAFVSQLAGAITVMSEGKTHLFAPFLGWSKADIVRRGVNLLVPFNATWSCYEGGDMHCGKCGTCVERREAFKIAGVADPVQYAP